MVRIGHSEESTGLSSVEVCLHNDDKNVPSEQTKSQPNPQRWSIQRSLSVRRKHSNQSSLPKLNISFHGPSLTGDLEALTGSETSSASDSSDATRHVPLAILLNTDPATKSSDLESIENEAGCEGFSLGNILSTSTDAQPTTGLLFPSLMGSEAEDTSVKSANYFDLSDFSPLDWSRTLTENDFMAGLAALYLAVGLTHPLMFLAGIMTAAGTATTIGAGYDCLMENAFCSHPDGEDESSPKNGEIRVQPHGQDKRESSGKQRRQLAPMTSVPTLIHAMSTLVDILPENWIETHYPPLEETIADAREVKGLNVKQFFSVFFSDEAPYNFLQFQKKRGDKDIVYGKWKPVELDAADRKPLSMHPDAKNLMPDDLEYEQYLTRTLEFQAKTNNTFFGPPYAKTKKVQRILLINKRIAVMEVKTTLADIPFCDRFNVMERWIISADKREDGGYVARFSTSVQVFFYKSCPFESQIRSKTISSITDVCNAWYHMAIQALRLSEQHKEERIRQEMSEDFTGSDPSDVSAV